MKKTVLFVLSGLCVLAVVCMVLALCLGKKEPQFAPPPFEKNACAGVPQPGEDTGYAQMDAKAFRFSAAGELTAENGEVALWLTNPQENSVWLKVRIYDAAGALLGESGLLRPGEYVRAVRLSMVPQKTTEVTLKVMAYEPQSYYSAGAATMKTVLKVL